MKAQRLGHAIDRTTTDRLVAVERERASLLGCQPARQQTQQRAGVTDVDRLRRHARLAQARAAHRDHPVALLHQSTERLHRRKRRVGVGGVQVVLDPRRLGGHRTQQGSAMRDRLVGRSSQLTVQPTRGLEAHVHRDLAYEPETSPARRSSACSARARSFHAASAAHRRLAVPPAPRPALRSRPSSASSEQVAVGEVDVGPDRRVRARHTRRVAEARTRAKGNVGLERRPVRLDGLARPARQARWRARAAGARRSPSDDRGHRPRSPPAAADALDDSAQRSTAHGAASTEPSLWRRCAHLPRLFDPSV